MIAALLAIALLVLPAMLGSDWIKTLTSVAIYSVVPPASSSSTGASG